MAVNFNLLAPQQGPQNFYQGLMQGQEQAAQNAMAQQKMAQEQEMNALRRAQIQQGMRRADIEMAASEEDRAKARRLEKTAGFRDRLARVRDPESARNVIRMQYADPDLAPVVSQYGTLEQALAEVPDDPAALNEYLKRELMGIDAYRKSQELKVTPLGMFDPTTREYLMPPPKPEKPVTPPMVAEYQFAQTPQGGGFRGSYQEFVVQREAAKRPPPQPRVEGGAAQRAPVGYRFTPAGDLEPIPGGPAARGAETAEKPLTPVQAAKRRDQLGKEFKSAQSALQTTQDVLDSISFVKNEPGLSRATGFTGMLPSFSEGAAASAETRLANLRGKITALGKAAAASTGTIGSIANQEWKILADQIAAIDPVKGKGPLLDQLSLVEAQAMGAMERIRDAYQRQFGEDFERFPQFADLPAPKSSFKPRKPAAGAAPAAAAPAPAQGAGGFRYLGKVSE